VKEKGDFHIFETVNRIGEEVDEVLKRHSVEKYFEEILLLYSLIENLLKWSVFVKILWDRTAKKDLGKQELFKLRGFCRGLRFSDALNVGLSLGLVDFDLYEKIDEVRTERTDVTHQLWIYEHRGKPVELRKNLEMLRRASKELIKVAEKLGRKIGVERIYQIRL